MVNQSLKFGYYRSLSFSLYPRPSSKLIHFPPSWHLHLILPLHYPCYWLTPCPTFSSWIILLVSWIFSFYADSYPHQSTSHALQSNLSETKIWFWHSRFQKSQVPNWVENKSQSWDPRLFRFLLKYLELPLAFTKHPSQTASTSLFVQHRTCGVTNWKALSFKFCLENFYSSSWLSPLWDHFWTSIILNLPLWTCCTGKTFWSCVLVIFCCKSTPFFCKTVV